MTAIAVEVWRVAVEEAVWGVAALDDVQGVGAFYLAILEAYGHVLGEAVAIVDNLFGGAV